MSRRDRDVGLQAPGLPHGRLVVPQWVRLVDSGGEKCLEWSDKTRELSSRDLITKGAQPTTACLGEFLRLRDGEDRLIRSFAERWGPIALCGHGLPYYHALDPGLRPPAAHLARHDGLRVGCAPVGRDPRQGVGGAEPLSAWRDYAARAHAILRVAMALNEGDPGAVSDWETALRGQTRLQVPAKRASLNTERELLVDLVQVWLTWGNVRPYLRWSSRLGKLRVSLAGERLFGLLAVQIAAAAAGADRLIECEECHSIVSASRSDQRFCSDGCRSNHRPERVAARLLRKKASRQGGQDVQKG